MPGVIPKAGASMDLSTKREGGGSGQGAKSLTRMLSCQ